MKDEQYEEIAKRLFMKTMVGRVQWQPTVEPNTFICTIEGEYTFEVAKREEHICLTMRDTDRNEIFELRARAHIPPMSGFTIPVMSGPFLPSPDEIALSQLLNTVYESARRSALDVDKKLKEAAGLLEKL